jgi:hypothetical protein
MSQRLAAYPGLVDSDAGWLRNSAAHMKNKYVAGKDALLMWDRKRPETLIPVNELLDRVERMYQISSQTIQRVGQLYAIRNLFRDTGLHDEFVAKWPTFLSGNEEDIRKADSELADRAQTSFAPMIAFFNAHGIQ